MASVSGGGNSTTFVALFEQLALNGIDSDKYQTDLKALYPQEDHLTMTELFGVALAARKNMWKAVGEDWMRLVSLGYDSNLIDRISPVLLRILAVKKIDLPQASFEALKRTAKNQKLETPPLFEHPTAAASVEYERLNRRAKPYITQLRNRELPMEQFRAAADKLAQLMAFEAEAALPSQTITVATPLVSTSGVLSHQNVVLIPILRSGAALQDTFKNHFRTARVGMIGMKRDEKTAIAETYLQNLPEITAKDRVLILEPMIATGGSLSTALSLLASRGIKPEQILIISFIAAPQGLLRLRKEYPAVRILIAQIDVTLNEHKFIVPGLGDFGDRYFGT